MENGNLVGRTAVVTSGHKGIGARISLALASAGADVALHCHRDQESGRQICSQIAHSGRQTAMYTGDLTDPAACRRLVASVLEDFGKIDILVNNTGVMLRKPAIDHDDEEFHAIMYGTVGAAFFCSRAVIPGMRRQSWGRIVNLGAAGAERAAGRMKLGIHMAGKAGVLSLTRTLAMEEGPHGITVNAVCPGDIRQREIPLAEAVPLYDDRAPVKRPGTGDDIARVIAFLCLPESGYINGAAISVGGGWEI